MEISEWIRKKYRQDRDRIEKLAAWIEEEEKCRGEEISKGESDYKLLN